MLNFAVPLNNIGARYGGIVAAAVAIAVLYRKYLLSSKNGVPLPPGPPARWFWSNALPTVK